MKQELRRRFPGLGDVYSILRHGSTQIPAWIDLVKTWRQTSYLRDKSLSADKTALVSFATESVFEVKVLLSIASGLLVRGWDVKAIFPSITSRRSGLYCQAFGVSGVNGLDKIPLTPHEAVLVEARVASKIPSTISALKDYDFEGVWLGPQLLSSISRKTYTGFVDLRDDETRRLLVHSLPVALASVFRAKTLLNRWSPILVLCMEPNHLGTAALVDLAVSGGSDVVQVTQPWREDAFICKRLTAETRRMHPSSVAAEVVMRLYEEEWPAAADAELETVFKDRYSGRWTLQARNQPNVLAYSREDLTRRLNLDPRKKLAVIFSHILWDANLFYGEDLFDDYGEWFVQTVAAACANNSVGWLIKLHPANVWKRRHEAIEKGLDEIRLIKQHVGPLPSHVQVLLPNVEISALSLYKAADYGVTVRGTAGMEMPCFGKPVITAGTGRYSSLGFTVDSTTRDEYMARLRNIQEVPPLTAEQTRRARVHAYAALLMKPWQFEGLRTEISLRREGQHPLDHNARLEFRSREDLLGSRDLQQWTTWATESRDVDLLSAERFEGER